MPGEIRKLAAFLDIEIDEEKWDDILLHCSFDYMKENATKSVPMEGIFWDGGAKTFIHKGINGRWRDVLSEADIEAYLKIADEQLGSDCANWLISGEA